MRSVDDMTIVAALEELASEADQRRLWTSSSGEVSSFEEAVSRLFDDSGLGLSLEKSQIIYTPEIDEQLRRLALALDRIDGQRSPGEIIEDPLMEQIRLQSKDLVSTVQRLAENAS